MKWRLIPFSENSAALNMGIDHSILENVSRNESPPTIRFYGWQPSAITIGTFQCRDDEVDLFETKLQGIDVVRRITGGGAVYHDNDGEITYSIIAPESMFDKDILLSYKQICSYVINAFKSIDINASFKPINDILVDGKKISGNAQTRRKGVLLQHGTILYDVHVVKMFSMLKVSKEKVSDKFVQSVQKAVTSVLEQNPLVTKNMLLHVLVKSFISDKDYETGHLTETELNRAKILALEKYSSEQWNNCRK